MIDVAELRGWLESPASDDSILVTLEKAAVADVEQWTRRTYRQSAQFSEIVIGDGSNVLYLTYTPVTAVASVVERYQVGATDVPILTGDATGWLIRDGYRLVRKAGGIWTYNYEYQVTYTAGYALNAEPANVRQVVIDLVSLSYGKRGSEALESESIGDYSYTKSSDSAEKSARVAILERLPRGIRL